MFDKCKHELKILVMSQVLKISCIFKFNFVLTISRQIVDNTQFENTTSFKFLCQFVVFYDLYSILSVAHFDEGFCVLGFSIHYFFINIFHFFRVAAAASRILLNFFSFWPTCVSRKTLQCFVIFFPLAAAASRPQPHLRQFPKWKNDTK